MDWVWRFALACGRPNWSLVELATVAATVGAAYDGEYVAAFVFFVVGGLTQGFFEKANKEASR